MHRQAIALALLLALAACGGTDDTAAGGNRATTAPADPALPAPGSDAGGSVTGMPLPGSADAVVQLGAVDDAVGEVASVRDEGLVVPGLEPAAAVDGAAALSPPPALDTSPATRGGGTTASDPPASTSTGTGANGAMDTIRSYYSAISAGNYAGAHRLWSGEGSASGQSLKQFASGFADTADVRVHMMEPQVAGGAAAGSQYITVPVTLDTTRRDGSSVQFTGSYHLRRPGDGSGDWRIDSADLREVQR